MSTYIALCNWTQHGVQSIKDSPSRLDQARAAVEAAGGRLMSFYMTIGEHDMVVVVEAPSDEVYAKVMLAIASHGSVRSQTLKAFSEDEYKSIVGSI
jgi:uncharacterized protein with GYD domain